MRTSGKSTCKMEVGGSNYNSNSTFLLVMPSSGAGREQELNMFTILSSSQ